jgi:hypothetical protein
LLFVIRKGLTHHLIIHIAFKYSRTICKNKGVDRGSGFPAAIKLSGNNEDRGWKAAPTSKN